MNVFAMKLYALAVVAFVAVVVKRRAREVNRSKRRDARDWMRRKWMYTNVSLHRAQCSYTRLMSSTPFMARCRETGQSPRRTTCACIHA